MYKSKLQELCHQSAWDLPVYATVKDGPDHGPRFTTTVTVNGLHFESPQNQCKSSKESQNVAAKLAYDHFSAASPTSPSPGFVALSDNVDVRPAMHDNLPKKVGENVRNSPASETPVVQKDETDPKDLLHVYKNRLQHYTQKKNLTLPEYSYEFDGPPHARLYGASVMIDGRTYQSVGYYPTLKDAEHAAAKVALESLSVGEIQEDEGLYKTLLQELAQKQGFYFPSYSTVKTGPSHMPTFVSTVEVGGETYQGRECKTKKLSEMSAAKVAYNGLMERRTVNNIPPVSCIEEYMGVPSLNLQPAINDKCRPSMGAETTTESYVEIAVGGTESYVEEAVDGTESYVEVAVGGTDEWDGKSSVLSPGSDRKEPLEVSSTSLDSFIANELQKNIQPKPITVKVDLDAAVKGAETNAKRCRWSSQTENEHDSLPETSPLSSALTNTTPSSCSMPSVSVESDAANPGGGNIPSSKTVIFRRGSTMEIPEGAAILPCSDDKWVAMRVELNQNQQPQ